MKSTAAATIASLMTACTGFAQNPFVQTIYTADPAPMVYRGTLYVFTGHDEDKSTWFTMKDWRCYSTQDMVNWTDHGSPLSLADFSWAKSDAWAGQVVERGGKFYFYVPVNQQQGGMAIGVAVADRPTGPYKDALGKPLVHDRFGDIDPSAFVDSDGKAYLYWGNPVFKYVLLNPDMISYDKSVGDGGIFRGPMTIEAFGKREGDVPAERKTLYEEGPWLYKRQGIYYMFFAGGPVPEHLGYSTGPTATGPWTYRGVVMPTQGRSFTNHPGVIDYKGKTYLFYHNGDLPGGGGFTRSVCVDELKFEADGSVRKMDMTKEGPKPVGTLNPYARVEAETIAWAYGVETERNPDGGMNVTDIEDGDAIKVRNVRFGAAGASKFRARVGAAGEAGAIEVRLDAKDGPLVGTLQIPASGSKSGWQELSTAIRNCKGIRDLYFVFRGEGYKFDSWQFERIR